MWESQGTRAESAHHVQIELETWLSLVAVALSLGMVRRSPPYGPTVQMLTP